MNRRGVSTWHTGKAMRGNMKQAHQGPVLTIRLELSQDEREIH